jgi:hypothetical protein
MIPLLLRDPYCLKNIPISKAIQLYNNSQGGHVKCVAIWILGTHERIISLFRL